MRAALLFFALLTCAPARGDTPSATLLGIALPSRRAAEVELSRRVQTALQRASALQGAALAPPQPLVDLSGSFALAGARAASGDLDQAAELYEVALQAGNNAVYRLTRPELLLDAYLGRATIALARAETGRAEALIGEARALDPSLELTPAEKTPRLAAAMRAARASAQEPPLPVEHLGSACATAAIVLVARVVEHGLEWSRLEQCRVVARAISPMTKDDEAAMTALFSISHPTAVRTNNKRPVYRRAWFWAVLGVAVTGIAVGAGVGAWAATRGPTDVHVSPMF